MYKIGILGATGIVGQKLISLLINHPWFKIQVLGASPNNTGKKYSEICKIHPSIDNIVIQECLPDCFSECHFIFSCLQSNISYEIEKIFLKKNFIIFSNCHNFRLHPHVPLVVPTVNYTTLTNFKFNDNLQIITNANCSTTGIVTILHPLDLTFGVQNVMITTLQSISGAGKYFDESIQNNTIPFIKNEEEKIQSETFKILNKQPNDFAISATCNRVPVLNGHTVCMSITFLNKPSIDQIINCLNSWNDNLSSVLNTPTGFNNKFIEILSEENRPQPIIDVDKYDGFCVSVGRIRKCNVFDVKLTIHFNNIVLGAAGSALLNAELFFKSFFDCIL